MTTAEAIDFSAFSFQLCEAAGPAARHSYYYRSFSCFSEMIFSKALSFRMMLFSPREAP